MLSSFFEMHASESTHSKRKHWRERSSKRKLTQLQKSLEEECDAPNIKKYCHAVQANNPKWNCPICMDPITPGQDFHSGACKHLFHSECLKSAVEYDLSEKKFPLSCPQSGCQECFSIQDLEDLGFSSEEQFQWVSAEINGLSYVQICLKCKQSACKWGHSRGWTKNCDVCNTSHCFRCGESEHTGGACADIIEDLIASIEAFENLEEGNAEDGEAKAGACPHCFRIIQKNGGCSDMVCGRNYDDDGTEVRFGCGERLNWANVLSIQDLRDKLDRLIR